MMFIKPPNINSSDTKALFTTKTPFNLKDLTKELNVSIENIYFPEQKHTDKIHVLESDLKPAIADAVLTKEKGLLLGIKVADCVPVLLYDKKKSIIGAVHAGWKGTAHQILKSTIKIMQEKFGSSAENILIAIGPSIRQCCYNVGDDVKNAVIDATGVGKTCLPCLPAGRRTRQARFRDGDYCFEKDNKQFVDLSSANIIQALSMGVLQQNIWQSGECTSCNPGKFYSYRYTKGTTGRQCGFIGIW